MTELVLLHHNKPMTTSLAIAEGVGMAHHSVLVLLRKHAESLAEFGGVEFQIQPFETEGGRQCRDVYYLNEPQSTLLITFMRNSPVVIAFKVALVKAFFELRDRLTRQQVPELGQPMQADHRADLAVSAARTFNAMLRAGKALKLPLAAAAAQANDVALRKTGVDVMGELGVAADDLHPRLKGEPHADDGMAAALRAWSATAGPGPWRMVEIAHQALGLAPDSTSYMGKVARVGAALRTLGFESYYGHPEGQTVRLWRRAG